MIVFNSKRLKPKLPPRKTLVLPNQQYLFDFSQQPPCGIAKLPKLYPTYNAAWGFFQKDSSYVRLFNSYINRMKETGVFQRIYYSDPVDLDFERERTKKCPDKNKTGQAIGFENCITAFLVLGAGIAAAALVLIAEKLYEKVSTKKPMTEEPARTNPQPNELTNQAPGSELDIEVVSVEDVELSE